jgi:hypothetical protein
VSKPRRRRRRPPGRSTREPSRTSSGWGICHWPACWPPCTAPARTRWPGRRRKRRRPATGCAEAQQRLDGVRAQLARLEGRLAELAEAGRAYADALAAKERYLTTSADPRGVRLLALAEERGRLAAELPELHRAADDADAAGEALAEVRDRLGTAANWSAFDTYFDHGIVANAIKHDRIDQAAQAAREADQRLAALRSDLAELGGLEPTAPRLEIGSGFRFADIFFNNLFTDLAVGRQIREAQDNVERSAQQVRALRDRLEDQVDWVTGRLGAMDAERGRLLAW